MTHSHAITTESAPRSATGANSRSAENRIGVIIPVYNRPKLVLDAITCVAQQTRPPHRLLIVDDGSTDQTVANIDTLLARLQPAFEVKLIQQARGGVSTARNRAANELTDCKVLAMIDSDDLWPVDYLARMVPPMQTDVGVAATFCDQSFLNTIDGSRRHRDLAVYANDTTRRMFLYGPPTPSCTVIRGDLFRKLGGYDQSLTCSEDYDLHLRLSLEGRWAYVPGVTVTMRRATGESRVTARHLTELKDVRITTQRVMMLDRFARELSGRRAMPWRGWRQALARQWSEQGRVLREHGEVAQAVWCYGRAVETAPWLIAAWTGFIATRLRALPVRPVVSMPHVEAAV
jgi:cellulose synthase/poly-beta-1,6-N-acetylglucosamine synthase-like glycosyltransferase